MTTYCQNHPDILQNADLARSLTVFAIEERSQLAFETIWKLFATEQQKKLVTSVDEQGDSLIHKGACFGNAFAIQSFFSLLPLEMHHAAASQPCSSWNDTPSHLAARVGDCQTIEILAQLYSGNPLQLVNYNHGTAVHLAAKNNACDVLRLLLKENADVHAMRQDNQGFTPLMRCIENGHVEALETILGCLTHAEERFQAIPISSLMPASRGLIYP
ncbi:MAG: ankyrin repeat domain-containing protein [Chlamydiia bacterium]|nr:ankyrin repeat domain-containing protein [Chlamydiia bacterium]